MKLSPLMIFCGVSLVVGVPMSIMALYFPDQWQKILPSSLTSQPSDFNAIANYKSFLSSADPDRKFILDVKQGTEGEAVIVVSEGWLIQPKEARLENAQNLWERWVAINGDTRADHWRIKIVDQDGERVGGSGVVGSFIDVE